MNQLNSSENSTEINVDQVAAILEVSERTVLNYIKARQIKAVKVGKRWFVDRASFESFQKNRGTPTRNLCQISPSEGEDLRRGMKNEESTTEQATLPQKEVKFIPQCIPAERRKEKKNIKSLACYRLTIEAFKMPMWQQTENKDYSKCLKEFRYKILEHLGAGYCSFGPGKRYHYDQVRGLVGSILALMYSDDNASTIYEKDLLFLENDLLLAITSLIRKIERITQRNFSPRESHDNF